MGDAAPVLTVEVQHDAHDSFRAVKRIDDSRARYETHGLRQFVATKVANLSRDWGQLFLDATIAIDQPLDEALNALEDVATEFRADPSWSPMLLDGPRVLGVESLAPNGTIVRLQVRTAPTRQDDVARELRRRIQIELAGRGIQLGGLQRMQLIASEREARRVGRE